MRKLPKSLQISKYTSYLDLHQAQLRSELPTINDVNNLINISPPCNMEEFRTVIDIIRKLINNSSNKETTTYLMERIYEIELAYGCCENTSAVIQAKRQKK